jgi:hypothetical protein
VKDDGEEVEAEKSNKGFEFLKALNGLTSSDEESLHPRRKPDGNPAIINFIDRKYTKRKTILRNTRKHSTIRITYQKQSTKIETTVFSLTSSSASEAAEKDV